MATTTISAAGAHTSVERTDRLPASKGGTKGYHTISSLFDSFTLRGSAPTETDALTVTSPETTTGGYYSNFECKGLRKLVFVNTETLPQTESGAIRDALFVQHVCEDVVDLDAAVYRAISSGIRIVMSSKHNGSIYQRVYHDLHGITAHAIGNVGDAASERGVSGIIANAYNSGGGVATNEFGAENPAGGLQSSTIQAVIGIALNGVADSDSTHTAYGVRAVMRGYKGTAAFFADNGSTFAGQSGGSQYGVQMDGLTVTTAALFMPASASGNVGTRILYDTNDYSQYDRSGNAYGWYIGSSLVLSLGSTGPVAQKFTATDTADTATEEVLKLEGDRATPAAFDQIQTGWYLSSSTGVQTKVAVTAAQATVVTNGSMTARLGFSTISSGTMAVRAYLESGGFYPNANDGMPLGIATLSFSDLFLASGAVINFNNGNLTMTHSAGALAITGVTTVASATATPAGGSTSARLLFGTTAGFGVYYGSGAPTVSAAQGSIYLRSDGSSTSTRMYVNTNGSTTWTNVTTAA